MKISSLAMLSTEKLLEMKPGGMTHVAYREQLIARGVPADALNNNGFSEVHAKRLDGRFGSSNEDDETERSDGLLERLVTGRCTLF